jgi:hypothetical protein
MRADRDALRDGIRSDAFGFVEQALLFNGDILRTLLGGSAEQLAFEPAIFLFEEAHPQHANSEREGVLCTCL